MSISTSIQSHPQWIPAAWLGVKIAVVAVAVIILGLTFLELQAGLGAIPSDNAMTWVDGGE
jgi:uncharacterized membrane protein YczE